MAAEFIAYGEITIRQSFEGRLFYYVSNENIPISLKYCAP